MTEATKIINSAFADFGKNIALDYSRLYGQGFVNAFIKYPSVRSACSYACKWFESTVFLEGEQDLKARGIKKPDFAGYVERFKIDEKTKSLLERTLNMIFILRQ